MRDRAVLMAGPSRESLGGMATALQSYYAGGLFDAWPIEFVATYDDAGGRRRSGMFLQALMRIVPMLLGGQVGLLYLNSASRGSFYRKAMLAMFAFALRRPVALHIHSGEFEHFYANECGPLRRWLVRHVLKNCDTVVVLTEGWRRRLAQIAPTARLTTIAYTIPIPATVAPPAGRRPSRVVFLGRLRRSKGVFDLLRAAARAREQMPELELVCAGDIDPRERVELEAEVDRLDLARTVRFPGWVSGADKLDLLRSSRALVLPSHAEGLPLCVLEAMAHGVPVVGTRVGGIPEAIRHGVDGLIVERGDVAALADALVEVLGDEQASLRMGLAARARCEELYATSVVFDALGGVFRRAGIMPRSSASDGSRRA